MGSEGSSSSSRTRKRVIAAAAGASLLVMLFVAGLAFSSSIGASRVAENATALHWANASLGTSSLARAALVQAATFVELEDQGLATDEEVGFAIEQAQASYDELLQLQDIGPESPSLSHLARFTAVVRSALTALETDDYSEAEELIVGDLESAHSTLAESLQDEQRAIQAEISGNTETAARTNGYIVFVLTLLIPGAAVVTYWWIARRQVREFRIKADAELEAERAVSRAKDAFVAGLSHELRTPLTSIYGFAQILTETEADDGDDNKEVAHIIANEAAEMTRMVDDLLMASRLEATGIEIDLGPTRVSDVVESAIAPFERAGAEIQREPSSAVANVDEGRLRHILVNLLSNAVRHGGPKVGVGVSSDDETVEIEVWDNGAGVPDDHMERLFERFIHDGAKPLLAGSVGLGLAVASRLASMMGGSISHQRYSGRTYFTMQLPAHVATEGDDDVETVAEAIRAMSG